MANQYHFVGALSIRELGSEFFAVRRRAGYLAAG